MVNINMATKGAMNHDSILSINVPDPQSVKNQTNITTLIKPSKYGQAFAASEQPQYRQPSAVASGQPRPSQPSMSPSQSPRPSQPSTSTPRQPQTVQSAFTSGQQGQNVQPAFSSTQQNTGHTAPVTHIIPTLCNKVQKGQKAALSTAPLDSVNACFGWNTTDARCDVDVSAFLLGANGKVIGDSWFVFYGQTRSPDQSIEFMEDGTTDREKIQINLKKLNSSVKKIVFVLTINEALQNHLNFGMMKDAYIRIIDHTGKELVSFMMTEYYTNVISMMIGELYQHNGIWKFNAIGNGVAKDLAGLCELYGVQVVS